MQERHTRRKPPSFTYNGRFRDTSACYLKLAETVFQKPCAKSTSHNEQVNGF